MKRLCKLPMSISESPWVNVVWNPNTRRMMNANQSVAEALFLYMVGHRPRTSRINLSERYRELLGQREGTNPLGDVQVNGLR